MKLARRVARRERRDAHRVLVEKPEGKRLLGRPRRRWEGNIEIILKIGRNGVDWVDLAQDTTSGGLW
jgi:hypothetical protein